MQFKNELEFETALINRLFKKGWSNEVLQFKTEQDLIQNWATILFNNNKSRDRLNDVPLTSTEMDQILEIVKRSHSPFDLHSFINGESVIIKRDNPQDIEHLGKEVSLRIFQKNAIAGGKSIYQIAEQPIFKKKNPVSRDRRGDFMLLINGMPLIHVELKNEGHYLSEAVNQIEKYTHEGVFTGLFSLVQIFVAMKPSETVYFANPGQDGKFFKEFQFHWADFNNERIDDWEDIAEYLLSIPMAHMLIAYYTVADSADHNLKVLRSYQYNAVAQIYNKAQKVFMDEEGTHDIKGGYIWHTTGSGKTLTSFKTAELISNSNIADKVVFLLDRIELGIQSLDDYKGFADADESVQGTENSDILFNKLDNDNLNDSLIVTSIQKMDILAKKAKEHQISLNKINNKKIIMIIDECHRDTFGEMMANIKEEFNTALYFGFTGTPIHDENSKKGCTTPDIFGEELHRYTIADGIRDGNVLGFDPEGISTFDEYELRKQVALEQAKAKTETEALNDDIKKNVYLEFMNNRRMEDIEFNDGTIVHGIEYYIPSSQYSESSQKHKKAVVDNILSRFLTVSANRKFHGIFATSSINDAIEYYRLFKLMMHDEKYPKLNITAIFDPSIDNNDNCIYKEDGLVEIITDYNTKFKRSFSISTAGGFKKDACLRLAHKDQYVAIEKDKDSIIDLVIVVDQLLTGFDSKWVNVLYLDKLLKNEQIIQAFSRTNRLFNKIEKPHGIIKMYRKPNTMIREMTKALKLYSGDRPYGVFVDKLDINLDKSNVKFKEIRNIFKTYNCNNFSSTSSFDEIGKAKFAKEFIRFNQLVVTCRVQGMSWKEKIVKGKYERLYTEEDYLSLLQRYKELVKGTNKKEEKVAFDIDSAIMSINTDLIDTQFMQDRFDKWLKDLNEGSNDEKTLDDLHNSFSTLSEEDQKVAQIIIDDIHNGDLTVEDNKSFRDYIELYKFNAKYNNIKKLSEFTGIPFDDLKDFMDNVDKDQPNEYGRLDLIKSKFNKQIFGNNLEKKYNMKFNPIKIQIKLDKILRDFIEASGFDINEY